MSRMMSEQPQRGYLSSEERRLRDLSERASSPGSGLLVAGLAALGLGALAWYYFGPDLRRYLKIRSM